jgi:hypothetical protein
MEEKMMTTVKSQLPNNERKVIFRVNKSNYLIGWYDRAEECFKHFKRDEVNKHPVVDVHEWWELPEQGTGFRINHTQEVMKLVNPNFYYLKPKIEPKIKFNEEESE